MKSVVFWIKQWECTDNIHYHTHNKDLDQDYLHYLNVAITMIYSQNNWIIGWQYMLNPVIFTWYLLSLLTCITKVESNEHLADEHFRHSIRKYIFWRASWLWVSLIQYSISKEYYWPDLWTFFCVIQVFDVLHIFLYWFVSSIFA